MLRGHGASCVRGWVRWPGRARLKPVAQASDLKGMATDAAGAPEHHISGLYTNMLMDSLAARLPEGAIHAILHRAGETRSLDELTDVVIVELLRPVQTAAPRGRRQVGLALPATSSRSCCPIWLIGHGESPRRSRRSARLATSWPADQDSTRWCRSGATRRPRWGRTSGRSASGSRTAMRPLPGVLRLRRVQYALIPVVFNLPPGEVIEEECQCRGDAACLFRLRWQQLDEAASRAELPRVRAELLEARLEQIQDMITDLASNERYEDVLQGFVGSSLRTAVGAGGALLALEPRAGQSTQDLLRGAHRRGGGVDRRRPPGRGGRARQDVVAVDVASARRHYGVLAVDEGGGVFSSLSQSTLETYARLAAAALDTADALEEARHQANTAQVLLDLATSLTEIVSTQEMAAKVAQAVPDIIDCDRAAVFLDDGDLSGAPATDGSGWPDRSGTATRRWPRSARSRSHAGVRTTRSSTTAIVQAPCRVRQRRRRCPPRSSWPARPSAPSWPASPPTPSA